MLNQVTIKNADTFNATLRLYETDLGKEFKEVVQQQTKLLADELMDQTPPFPRGTDGTSKAGETLGKEAVRRDIFKSVAPAEAIFSQQFSNPKIADMIRRKQYDKLNAVMEKSEKLKKWKAVPFTEDLHKNVKYSYSKYSSVNVKKIMTMDTAKYNRYVKKVQDRVGYLKSGWALTVARLGGKVPAWVKKHLGYSPGSIIDNSANEKPQIIIENESLLKLSSKMNFAFQKRSREMQEDIAYKLKYLARQRRLGK